MSYVKEVFKEAHVPVDFEEIAYSGSENSSETEEFGRLALLSMHRNGVGIKVGSHQPQLNLIIIKTF